MHVNPLAFVPLLAKVYRVWYATLRLRLVDVRHLEEARVSGKPLVLALWHDELFVMPGYRKTTRMDVVIIVSQSKDGEFIARLLEKLGFRTARGSSTRGGVRALVEVRRLMRENGADAAVTVDGPRGPRHEVKEGAVYLAARSGALLLPMRAVYSRAKRFASWDRFQAPWPFSRVRFIFGQAYAVPADLDAEGLAREAAKLKERLDGLA